MELTQLIFTSQVTPKSSLAEIRVQAESVIGNCMLLDITGRNFNINYESFTIKEGPTEALMRYYEAVLDDPWIDLSVLHQQVIIETREFDDFSIWVQSSSGFDLGPHINILSKDTIANALPDTLSSKLKIFLQSNLPREFFE